MGGKPKKSKPEPKVEIPQGDLKAGKALFEEQCSVCHALIG